MNGATIRTVKVEHVPSPHVKPEAADNAPSPYMDEDDVYEEDAGDLDFSQAQQQLWLSRIPRSLWETWSSLGDEEEEIEIGTIRVEGTETEPQRVSLKLRNLPQFKVHPKEYTLLPSNHDRARTKQPGNAFVFSEKDLPGYKGRPFAMNELDEDGNSLQGRSYLYEKARRDAKRKEGKGRFEPYARRPIPKQTAIAGVIMRDFECTPVKNEEYATLEILQAEKMLKPAEKEVVSFKDLKPPNYNASAGMSMSDKAALNKQIQARRTAAKENRAARVPRNVLIDKVLELFKEHRIWGLRDLKIKVEQPEAYVRDVLQEVATMWKSGDWNGKWELKNEYKERDVGLMNTTTVAPEAVESEAGTPSGMDDDDENEPFEDVG